MHTVQFASRVACVHSHSCWEIKDGSDGFEANRDHGDVRGYGFEREALDQSQHVHSEPDDSFRRCLEPRETLQSDVLAIGPRARIRGQSGPVGSLHKCHDKAIVSITFLTADVAEARLHQVLREKIIQQFNEAPQDQKLCMCGSLKRAPGGGI